MSHHHKEKPEKVNGNQLWGNKLRIFTAEERECIRSSESECMKNGWYCKKCGKLTEHEHISGKGKHVYGYEKCLECGYVMGSDDDGLAKIETVLQ